MTSLISNATADTHHLDTPTPSAIVDLDRLSTDLDEALSVAQAAKLVRSTPATIARWIAKGLPDHDGRIRRLSALRIGRRKYIRRHDLSAFLNALSGPAAP